MQPDIGQMTALKLIKDWFHHSPDRVFKLGGLAGTGKSSLIPFIHTYLGIPYNEIQYVAPTNKASLVVQRRLEAHGILANARTVHRSFYGKTERHCDKCPLTQTDRNVCHGASGMNACGCYLDFFAKMRAEEKTKLIICDESSMIGREVNEDLINICGDSVKILFIGDHGQLEAVEDNPETVQYFGKFDLMHDPDYILSEIHRQAENSPILELAYKARRGEEIDYGIYGNGISKVRLSDDLAIDATDRDLIGITYFSYKNPGNQFHRGRITVSELNASWRSNLGITSTHPIPGERIVCKDYIRSVGIPKGTLATINEVRKMSHDSYGIIALLDDGREYEGLVSIRQFNNNKVVWGEQHLDKWDYGYALTCHTAQGSEYNSVVIFEPSKGFIKWLGSESYSRWLYTAITRAKRNLLLVG